MATRTSFSNAKKRENRIQRTLQRRTRQASRQGTKLANQSRQRGLAAISDFDTAIGNQEQLEGVFNRVLEDEGVRDTQAGVATGFEQASRIGSSLRNLQSDINERSEGTFTTESQRRRQEAAEGAALNRQLGDVGAFLEPAVQNLGIQRDLASQRIGTVAAQQEKELEPLLKRIAFESEDAARRLTQFNVNKERELDFYANKLARNQQLTQNEWLAFEQRAADERAFQNERKLIAARASSQANLLRLGNKLATESESNPFGEKPVTKKVADTVQKKWTDQFRKIVKTGDENMIKSTLQQLEDSASRSGNPWKVAKFALFERMATGADLIDEDTRMADFNSARRSKIRGGKLQRLGSSTFSGFGVPSTPFNLGNISRFF